MSVIMEYHLLFIIAAFITLFITVFLLVIDNTKEKTMMAVILAGFNYLLCIINSLGFFGIGIIGYLTDGNVTVNNYYEMYHFYAIFLLMVFFNVVLIYYCYWLWVRDVWKIGDEGRSTGNVKLPKI